MDLNQIPQLIATLGFPVCVTIWLLYERYQVTQRMCDTLVGLRLALEKLSAHFELEDRAAQGGVK